MRRTIERTITVVTTTVWKISWQDDPTPSDPTPDSVVNQFLQPVISSEMVQDTVQHTAQFPTVTEQKEVDLWVEKPVAKKATDELSDDPYFSATEERK
jgi:hypothetical protein